MQTMTGECKFCKQITTFEWPGDSIPTQEELTEEATKACDCESARWYRDREYKINAAVESLNRILPNSEEQPAKEILAKSLYPVCDGQLHQVAINIGNGTKVKLQMAGESLKITRTDTSSRQESV